MNEINDTRCLNCDKVVLQTEGKREKKFCNVTCRSNYWQKQQTKKKKLPQLSYLNKQTNVAPITDNKPATIYSINTTNPDIQQQIQDIRNEKKPSFLTSAQHETSKRKRISDLELKLKP